MARAAAAKLSKYRAKRDFTKTSEPSGERRVAARGNSFVIQKHAARRLHYDFRLEHEGVLWSWSVPKGPSLSPGEKRLAVHVEDHPLDYSDFEGIIPKGQYGGGTVVVWDRGTWTPEGDAGEAMKRGRLTFTLEGEKLHGRWHLVRTKGDGRSESWLLMKARDEFADDKADIVEERPESVATGRTIDEVAEAADRVWQSDRVAEPTVAQKRAARIASAARQTKKPSKPDGVEELVARLPLGYPLTNLDKILYPDQGITKGQLIAYLAVVADWMLPHIAKRPLTLVRCPEGQGKHCFFQKHILPGSPPPIHRVPIVEVDDEVVPYMAVDDMPGLVALAQLGTLEIHTWGAHADNPEKPDFAVIDLDPDVGLGWEKVALAAFELRRRLNELGLESWVKTTGGKGLHVCFPVERRLSWDDFKAFTKALVETMERDDPASFVTVMTKSRRRGKIFLDYLRNGRNATFIAPYSPRARPGAPVAVPITWEELAHGVDPATFTTQTVPQRLAKLDRDPWHDIYKVRQTITAAAKKAVGMKVRT
jgi:bifunctional non-homologous end joining protein LigD